MDERVGAWRSEAYRYRDAVLWLREREISFADCARHYNPRGLRLKPRTEIQLYDYQDQAVAAWRRLDQRGIVVPPTGAGKTIVAIEAIREEIVYQEYWRGRPDVQSSERKSEKKFDNRLEILLREQARDAGARRAIEAWYQMRRIIAGSRAKLDLLEELFRRHAFDRTVVFTATNEIAYRISQLFLIPAITRRTNANERKNILRRFESGQYKAVVTSKRLSLSEATAKELDVLWFAGKLSVSAVIERADRLVKVEERSHCSFSEPTAIDS